VIGWGRFGLVATSAAIVIALTTSVSSASSRSSSATGSPIKIGMVTALTGYFAAERTGDVPTVQALIKSVNASGGVDGHPLSLIVEDDQSSTSGALTAVQVLHSDGVVGINFDENSVEGGAAQYLASNDIPTTGLGDSPSWYADSNMFGFEGYGGAPGLPATTTTAVFMKSLGASSVAGVTYANIPAAVDAVDAILKGAPDAGVKSKGIVNVQLSGNNWTATALQIKGLGVQGLTDAIAGNGVVSMVTAIHQEGVKLKAIVSPAGFEKSTLPSASDLQGTYWTVGSVPVVSSAPAAKAYRELLSRYAPGVFGGSQETSAYLGAYLLMQGLKADHGSSSTSALLKGIRSLTDFTGGGLLPNSMNFAKPKNTQIAGICGYVVEIKGNQFVPVDSKPICGKTVK
jgi:branched-chain amino acid transport system substrate-binding protein